MVCEFCREEMSAEAVVCPHCRRVPTAIKAKRRGGMLGWLGFASAVVVGIVVLLTIIGSKMPDKPLEERAKAACDQHYPGDLEGSQRCQTAILIQGIERIENDKLKGAKEDAGS